MEIALIILCSAVISAFILSAYKLGFDAGYKKKTEEKEKILREEYEIELTRDMREEIVEMGGLMEPLLEIAAEEAAEETKKNTLVESIRNLMETLNLTSKQAMDALQVPADKQAEYNS